MKTGIELIAEERARQIAAEGYTKEHDDMHDRGELAAAADSYRIYADKLIEFGDKLPPCFIPKQWPWERQWWKPSKDPMRNLVKAGALYQAQADFFRRRNKPDEVEVAEQFCVRLIAEKIDQLQRQDAPPEAVRVRGTRPDPVSDPIGWRKWWLACNPGKTWADAGVAWAEAAL